MYVSATLSRDSALSEPRHRSIERRAGIDHRACNGCIAIREPQPECGERGKCIQYRVPRVCLSACAYFCLAFAIWGRGGVRVRYLGCYPNIYGKLTPSPRGHTLHSTHVSGHTPQGTRSSRNRRDMAHRAILRVRCTGCRMGMCIFIQLCIFGVSSLFRCVSIDSPPFSD